MRTILNFEMGELGSSAAPAVVPAPPPAVVVDAPSLFASITTPSAAPRSRWGSSLGIAVCVHVTLVAGFAAASTMTRTSEAQPVEPEVVFYKFAPPPPPAPSSSAVATPTQPKVQARRPLRQEPKIPVEVKRVQPTPVAQPEPTPVAAPETAEAAPVAESPAAPVEGGVVGGVAGGVVGGTLGGVVGAKLSEPLKLSEVLHAPRPLKTVKPEYPRTARLGGVEGLVTVRIIIGTDGSVEPGSIRVMRSVRGLDEAAMSAIAQWRFTPAVGRDNRPVRVIVDVPMNFAL